MAVHGLTGRQSGAVDDPGSRFFEALKKIRSFEFDQGLLLLLDGDGEQVR